MIKNISISFFYSFNKKIGRLLDKHYLVIPYKYFENIGITKRRLFKQSYNLYLLQLLKQWQISKQLYSLIEVHYAQIKRNPE
jgi:hypothetical protein